MRGCISSLGLSAWATGPGVFWLQRTPYVCGTHLVPDIGGCAHEEGPGQGSLAHRRDVHALGHTRHVPPDQTQVTHQPAEISMRPILIAKVMTHTPYTHNIPQTQACTVLGMQPNVCLFLSLSA